MRSAKHEHGGFYIAALLGLVSHGRTFCECIQLGMDEGAFTLLFCSFCSDRPRTAESLMIAVRMGVEAFSLLFYLFCSHRPRTAESLMIAFSWEESMRLLRCCSVRYDLTDLLRLGFLLLLKHTALKLKADGDSHEMFCPIMLQNKSATSIIKKIYNHHQSLHQDSLFTQQFHQLEISILF